MTLAPSARLTPAPAPAPAGGGASALLLLPAAAVGGLGLGLAALAALAPAPPVPRLPPVAARTAEARTAPAPPEAGRDWAALFGRAPVAAPPPLPQSAPPPQPAYRPAADFDPGIYVLHGLAVATDDAEGFALLETPDGAMVLRRGSVLPEGPEVLEITAGGIIIDAFGEEVVIGFQDDRQPVGGAAHAGAPRSAALAPTDRFDVSPAAGDGAFGAPPLDDLDPPPGTRPDLPTPGPSGSFGRASAGPTR